jgi:hypothetical protein
MVVVLFVSQPTVPNGLRSDGKGFPWNPLREIRYSHVRQQSALVIVG